MIAGLEFLRNHYVQCSKNSPNSETTPQANHTIKLIPTDPVRTSKPDGETNIPEPGHNKKYINFTK